MTEQTEEEPTDEELECIDLEEEYDRLLGQNQRMLALNGLLLQEIGLMRVYHNMHPKESVH